MNDTANHQQTETNTPRTWITQDFEWPRATVLAQTPPSGAGHITSAFETDPTLTPEDIATAAAYLA